MLLGRNNKQVPARLQVVEAQVGTCLYVGRCDIVHVPVSSEA